MIKRIFAAACFALFIIAPAYATPTCSVKEYATMAATASGGASAQAASEPAVIDQGDIDFTSGHAESAAFNAGTKFIRIKCYAQAAFSVGLAPIATTGMSWIGTGETEYFGVLPNNKISLVAKP